MNTESNVSNMARQSIKKHIVQGWIADCLHYDVE